MLEKYDLNVEYGSTFYYMFVGRLKNDCIQYIIRENDSIRLWAGEPSSHIKLLTYLYLACPKELRPQWITYHQILQYKAVFHYESIQAELPPSLRAIKKFSFHKAYDNE